jgi:hypothetical protein
MVRERNGDSPSRRRFEAVQRWCDAPIRGLPQNVVELGAVQATGVKITNQNIRRDLIIEIRDLVPNDPNIEGIAVQRPADLRRESESMLEILASGYGCDRCAGAMSGQTVETPQHVIG